MNQGQQSQQQANVYQNPLEGQLNYKNYYRIMVLFFAVFVILAILQTYQFTQHKREKFITFL
ncbi:unnamed protein product [Paramecium octaurelia]|uniref:Uncharacterized protein n=1 Tax=Paramecium octaurelia TaxID=43137 RepID=A0A8S1UI44_PAROT|nr:unnamed protein product [Paramecium octaurelia]